jgi:hypothetical protein
VDLVEAVRARPKHGGEAHSLCPVHVLLRREGYVVKPKMIVSDNGTELTSNAILRWADGARVDWHYR